MAVFAQCLAKLLLIVQVLGCAAVLPALHEVTEPVPSDSCLCTAVFQT